MIFFSQAWMSNGMRKTNYSVLWRIMIHVFVVYLINIDVRAATYHGFEGVWSTQDAACGYYAGGTTTTSAFHSSSYETADAAADAQCNFFAADPVCNRLGTNALGRSAGVYIDVVTVNGVAIKDVFQYTCNANGWPLSVFFMPTESEEDKCEKMIGDPVDASNGESLQVMNDVKPFGFGGIEFQRFYIDATNNSQIQTPSFTRFSGAWSHSYSRSLVVQADSAFVLRPQGRRYMFKKTNGAWAPYGNSVANGYSLIDLMPSGYALRTPEDSIEYYNASGYLERVVNRYGLSLNISYDKQGKILSVNSITKSLTFVYKAGSASELDSIVVNSGHLLKYQYKSSSGNGVNLISVTYPDGLVQQYLYEDSHFPGYMTGVIDENNSRYVTWTHDTRGRVVANELASGANRVTLSYDSSSSTSVSDGIGTTRNYTFQIVRGAKRNVGISQPGGAGCSASSNAVTFDANGNVSSRTDFNGVVTTYSYDLSRNLETSRVEASGKPEARTISTAWHSYWRLPVKVSEPKKLTTWTYNGDGGVYCAPTTATVPSINGGTQPIGVLCSKTEQATADANGSSGLSATVSGTPRTWTWTYGQYGQVLSANGPRTDVSDITATTYYDAADPDMGKRGNIATITNALGHVTQINTYDLNGNPLTIVDPNGVITTLTYDQRQRLTSRSVGNEQTSYQYDGVGQLLKVTLPDGSFTSYTYDEAHRLIAIADALGNQIRYTLDVMGNRVKEEVKDPSGQLARSRQRIYDALNRLAQEVGAQNQITAYEYDANGNRTKVTDPLNQSTLSAYDSLNRLIAQTDPKAGKTSFGYNGQDRLTQVTDPRNLATTYTLDGLGNRLQQKSPDTGTSSSTYDAAGNELTRKDAKGQVTTTQYDALNRPTLVTYHDGSTTAYTWDIGTNGLGRLGKITESQGGTVVGQLQYGYDGLGRLISETRSIGTQSFSQAYTYTGGQLTGVTTPGGKQLTYTRNGAGQITQVSLTSSGSTKILAQSIAYQPFGGIKSYIDGAGQSHSLNYDQDGRVNSYSLGSTPWLVSYDAAGRITAQVDGGNANNSALYNYDALNRLTGATLPSSSYGYGYDATGNRTGQTFGGTTQTYTTASTSNRLQGINTVPAKSYTYDANGSVTGDGSNQYAYDAKGRLSQTTTAAGVTQYQVNSLGQRVRKTRGAIDVLYDYDPQGRLVSESDSAGKILREYVWLDDVPLAVLQ